MTLAIGMAVTGSVASFMANDKDLPRGNYGGITDRNANSVLTGTIKTTNVQVKVPIKASFDIDPNVTATAGGTVVTSPGADSTNQIITRVNDYAIINTSKVPLVADITGVKTDTGGGIAEDTPELVNIIDELTGTNVTFTICKNGDSIIYPTAGADSTGRWTTEATVIAGSPCLIAETPNDNILAPERALSMTSYGVIRASWKNGQNFRMIPTFTVALQSS